MTNDVCRIFAHFQIYRYHECITSVSSSMISDRYERSVLGVFPPPQQKYRILSGAVPLLCVFRNKRAYFYEKVLNSTRTRKGTYQSEHINLFCTAGV